MAGLALVYGAKTGSAGGAVLMDNADRGYIRGIDY